MRSSKGHFQTPFSSQPIRKGPRLPRIRFRISRRQISLFIVAVGLLCLFFVSKWYLRANLMKQVHDAGMILQASESEVTNREANLYQWAYSSPIWADKLGLILEANLARDFQLFSTSGHKFNPSLARKLRGWPLDRCFEFDFSGSSISDHIFKYTGKMRSATWCDLSRTSATDAIIPELVKQAPNLRELWLEETLITGITFAALSQLNHPDKLALRLGASQLDDRGLRQLRESVPDLLYFDLSQTRITGKSIPDLVALTKLRHLNLDGTQLSAEAWTSRLPAMKFLTQLRVAGMDWDTESVNRLLNACPVLTHLDFGTQPSAVPILHGLARPNKIVYLGLGDTPLTEANVNTILSLPNIQYLESGNDSCSPEIRSRLEKNLRGFVEPSNSVF